VELSPAGDRMLREIERRAAAYRGAERALWDAVAGAREAGVPWRLIALPLAVSAQAAQQRFSKPPRGHLT
jgi:hypothetical protein